MIFIIGNNWRMKRKLVLIQLGLINTELNDHTRDVWSFRSGILSVTLQSNLLYPMYRALNGVCNFHSYRVCKLLNPSSRLPLLTLMKALIHVRILRALLVWRRRRPSILSPFKWRPVSRPNGLEPVAGSQGHDCVNSVILISLLGLTPGGSA